ncbi:TfoX/Sxy family protein [Gemmatimonadota bacterium]
MPYDEKLDEIISSIVSSWGTNKKKMFGGTCHLLNGNMVAGVHKDYLILRLGEEAGTEALQESEVYPFDITGRPMKGWVMVGAEDLTDDSVKQWLEMAREFVNTLPSK